MRDLVTVLGSAAEVHAGESIQASGQWQQHREHGPQDVVLARGQKRGPPGVRGRAEIALRAAVSGGIGLDLSGSYDGIGSGGYNVITGKATVRVPLN